LLLSNAGTTPASPANDYGNSLDIAQQKRKESFHFFVKLKTFLPSPITTDQQPIDLKEKSLWHTYCHQG